jgi:DNA-binding transcriptional MerR regulator
MEEIDERLSIGEVAQRTGLSVHALRFYEREGLMLTPRLARGSGGHRRYGPDDVKWVGLCVKLRRCGMPLSEIRRYTELVREGPGNEAQRLDLLREQQRHLETQLADLQECRQLITRKVTTYEQHLANGTQDPYVPERPPPPAVRVP